MDILNPEAYRSILEALPTGVYLVDRERRIVLWSTGAEQLTGYLRQEVIGRACRDELLMHCDAAHSTLCGTACPLQETMRDGRPRSADVFLLHKNGERIPVKVQAVPYRDENGTIAGAIECFDRRTVLPALDPRLTQFRDLYSIDALTGLPDWTASEAALRTYLRAFEESPVPFGVLRIELDGVKALRSADGQKAVEAVYSVTARTLAGAVGPADFIGCWSTHGYLAILAACTPAALRDAAEGLSRLVQMERVRWWGESLPVALLLGGAIVQSGDTLESVVARAEQALAAYREQSEEKPI